MPRYRDKGYLDKDEFITRLYGIRGDVPVEFWDSITLSSTGNYIANVGVQSKLKSKRVPHMYHGRHNAQRVNEWDSWMEDDDPADLMALNRIRKAHSMDVVFTSFND